MIPRSNICLSREPVYVHQNFCVKFTVVTFFKLHWFAISEHSLSYNTSLQFKGRFKGSMLSWTKLFKLCAIFKNKMTTVGVVPVVKKKWKIHLSKCSSVRIPLATSSGQPHGESFSGYWRVCGGLKMGKHLSKKKKKKKKREINILQNATIRPYTSIQAQTGELLLC